MENELIFLIGEVIMMEIDEIESVLYPEVESCDYLRILMKSGKCYELHLKAL